MNGVLSGARTGTTNFTAYISPYFVVGNGGQMSKHIYMGSQRIVSKLCNSGTMTNPVTDTVATYKGSTVNYSTKYADITGKIKTRYDSLGVTYHGKDNAGVGFYTASSSTEKEKLSYFYHSDHLGSSSLITDVDGNVVQHIEYVPFGEVFVEERNNTWSTPYKFNGKELDEETGLYYYGARYMDPRSSVWISVDPLAEKYPNINSYNYCKNNPIVFLDPDGNGPVYSLKNGILNKYYTSKTGNDIKLINHNGVEVNFNQANLSNSYDSKLFISIIGDQTRIIKTGNANLKIYGYSPNDPDKNDVAYSVFNLGEILLNTNTKYNSNMYELQSTLRHEFLHLNTNIHTFLDHANIYLAQMGFDEFGKTSRDYQKTIVTQFAKRIMQALGGVDNPNAIQDSIDKFNDGTGKKYNFQIGVERNGLSSTNGVSAIIVYDNKNNSQKTITYDPNMQPNQ